MIHHKIPEKMYQVKAKWNETPKDFRELELNKIDQIVTELLQNTKKKCRKLRVGAIQINSYLSKLSSKWWFWTKYQFKLYRIQFSLYSLQYYL